MLLLDSAARQYAALRVATVAAGSAGKLDASVVREDLAVLDKKLAETVRKMQQLAPCLKR